MPRIPYNYPAPGTSEVADSIRQRRKDGELIELDGMLLYAPKIAEGHFSFGMALRKDNHIAEDVVELIVLRIAVLNHATYEWYKHEQPARAAGITSAQLAVVRDESTILSSSVDPQSLLSPVQRAAIIYADAMTRSIKVPQNVFDDLRSHFTDQQMVEVTAIIAGYNMVSRFLVALNVGDVADKELPLIDASKE